jgi:hypothetical protein
MRVRKPGFVVPSPTGRQNLVTPPTDRAVVTRAGWDAHRKTRPMSVSGYRGRTNWVETWGSAGRYERRALQRHVPKLRKPLREWSKRSRRELVFRLLNSQHPFLQAVTLTYPGFVPEQATKDQVRELVKRAKRDLNRWLSALRRNGELKHYAWVQEFQKRGAVHFHLLLCSVVDPKRLSLLWHLATGSARWCKREEYDVLPAGARRRLVMKGRERCVEVVNAKAIRHGVHVELLRNGDGAARSYAYAYAGKEAQKALPDGVAGAGRFWGTSRGFPLAVMASVVQAIPDSRFSDPVAVRAVRAFRKWVSRVMGRKVRGGMVLFGRWCTSERALTALTEALAWFAREVGADGTEYAKCVVMESSQSMKEREQSQPDQARQERTQGRRPSSKLRRQRRPATTEVTTLVQEAA